MRNPDITYQNFGKPPFQLGGVGHRQSNRHGGGPQLRSTGRLRTLTVPHQWATERAHSLPNSSMVMHGGSLLSNLLPASSQSTLILLLPGHRLQLSPSFCELPTSTTVYPVEENVIKKEGKMVEEKKKGKCSYYLLSLLHEMLAHHLYLKNSTWQKSNAFCLLAISLPSPCRYCPYIHTYRNVCVYKRQKTGSIGTNICFLTPLVIFFFFLAFFCFFFPLWFHHFWGNCSLLVPISSEER